MHIEEKITSKNPAYRQNTQLVPTGLMLHSVGCAQPSAEVFAKKWNSPDATVAVHAVIDANNGTIIQTLPWSLKGWHCGGKANSTHIGVEMCESDSIEYKKGSSFNIKDVKKARNHAQIAYNSAVELFAYLCEVYNLNPLKDIISHSEGCQKGLASNHVDPEHYWLQLSLNYTMDTFRKAVYNKMNANKPQDKAPVIDNKSFAEKVWNGLKSTGLNDFAVAGFMGNLEAESGLNPFNLQNTYNKSLNMTDEEYTFNIDLGTYTKDMFISDKAGYGLAQWTYKTRKSAMYDFIKARGLSIGDINGQVEFLIYELQNKYKGLLNELKTVKTIKEATRLVLTKYEKPKDQSEAVLNKRLTNSEKFYKIFIKEHLYRVRKSWKEPATQVGCFKNLDNAVKLANKYSYNVYDEIGREVYKS